MKDTRLKSKSKVSSKPVNIGEVVLVVSAIVCYAVALSKVGDLLHRDFESIVTAVVCVVIGALCLYMAYRLVGKE